MDPSYPKLKRRWCPRLRFSLRTLLLFVLLIGSGATLWWNWGPYSLGLELGKRTNGTNFFLDVSFSRDGKSAATAEWDCTSTIWDLATGRATECRESFGTSLDGTRFLSNKEQVLSWSSLGAKIWNSKTGDVIAAFPKSQRASVSFDGMLFASVESDDRICIRNNRGVLERTIAVIKPVYRLYFSSVNHDFLGVHSDGSARAWSADDGRLIFETHSMSWPSSVIFSPDGKQLFIATNAGDPGIYLLDSSNGHTQARISASSSFFLDVNYSPNGKQIVAASKDGAAYVWSAVDGQRLATLQHGTWVTTACYSPDNSTILTSAKDHTIRIWNAQTFKEIDRIRYDLDLPDSGPKAFYSPDGNYFVIAGATLQIWNIRRPWQWYGPAWLPEFWLTVLFAGGLFWSIWRDQTFLRTRK